MYQIDFKKPIHIHFMGIGGISMSGLAEILLKEGFTVSGSDIRSSDITEKLSSLGAKVFLGQVAENITDDIDLVVYTAAIHPENEEYTDDTQQQDNSKTAIASGELTGKRLSGDSVASVNEGNFVAENQTDFIFAVAGERVGTPLFLVPRAPQPPKRGFSIRL